MLNDTADILLRLTTATAPGEARRRLVSDFARINGWRPSEHLDETPFTRGLAAGHLLVEHGLANSAVITFLADRRLFTTLPHEQQLRLLELSYNNLVDWHLFPGPFGTTFVNNRTSPPFFVNISADSARNPWSADYFNSDDFAKPQAALKSLDESLIATVSLWKRALAADLGPRLTNARLAALFNKLIFYRAYEDDLRWQGRLDLGVRTLIDSLRETPGSRDVLNRSLQLAAERLSIPPLTMLGNWEAPLEIFRDVPRQDVESLYLNLYECRFAPYCYDFSLISKHALSRIYEHYVSLLRSPDSPQMALFTELPEEVSNRSLGAVYTPQYIARFFARTLRENLPPRAFRNLKVVDPACGSGMFLRTLLEMQYWESLEASADGSGPDLRRLLGIDVDPSACEATRLSLALLHLVAKRLLPEHLNVVNAEAIEHFQQHPEQRGQFDAVLANPPFVRWELLTPEMRQRVLDVLGETAAGKPDLFLALLKVGMELLRPGGFLLYVLPYTFLNSSRARLLRDELSSGFTIRYLIDLAEVPVFEGVGSYVVLLIAEKVPPSAHEDQAVVARIRRNVGTALQAALEGRLVQGPAFQVFRASQNSFQGEEWNLLPPEQTSLLARLRMLPPVTDFVSPKQGMISGRDSVFIRPASAVPKGESEIWRPLLRDRDIRRFEVPAKLELRIFYPFQGEKKLRATELERDYPETWNHLEAHVEELRARRAVVRETIEWWEPERPRSPGVMLQPKIVFPELMAVPKFALDSTGRCVVSHAPFLVTKDAAPSVRVLSLLVAILNSPVVFWQLSRAASKFQRGYSKVLPRTFDSVHVPNPAALTPSIAAELEQLVRERVGSSRNDLKIAQIDDRINELVADAFDLTDHERQLTGHLS